MWGSDRDDTNVGGIEEVVLVEEAFDTFSDGFHRTAWFNQGRVNFEDVDNQVMEFCMMVLDIIDDLKSKWSVSWMKAPLQTHNSAELITVVVN